MDISYPRVYRWEDIPEDWVRADFCRKVIHSKNLTVAKIFLKKGSSVKLHRHISEQITYVTSGKLEFIFANGERVTISEGEVICIPSNFEHGAIALEDTTTLEIFSPPREDWRSGTDYYLKA